MRHFADIVTYQPDMIEQILISDLHLPLIKPVSNDLGQAFLAQAFLKLLDDCVSLPNLRKLIILGDWFEVWLGDDVAETAEVQIMLNPLLKKLTQLQQNNCEILVMVGNRDFLLGQRFCDTFGGRLIKEPYYIELENTKIRLEHGDALCTDDKKYQRFRAIIRHPLTKTCLLALPIKKRQHIAHNLRQKSLSNNAQKSLQIMDVNATAVENALQDCDTLLHGHTHRPAVHDIKNKQRMVLGDWRVSENKVVAEIGVVMAGELALVTFTAT